MTYVPPWMVFDVETEEHGRGSTEMYRAAFRVSSAAFTWLDKNGNIKSEFIEGENAVGYFLERVVRAKIPLIAHNAQFEMGVVQCRYGTLAADAIWHADTMRLAQVYDNGGDKFALEAPLTIDQLLDQAENESEEPKLEATAGLGLVKCIRRILKRPDHKHEAHEWLRKNIAECAKGKNVGANLNRLPGELLRRYNIGDTEETARLYIFLTEFFAKIGYDWRLDHQLYFSSVRFIVDAKVRGVPVDRARLEEYRRELVQELEDIACYFKWKFTAAIKQVERLRLLAEVKKRKTLRGKRAYHKRCRSRPGVFRDDVAFNVGSNKQLEALFCGILGMRPKFTTDKGAPAFRSAVLSQWGEGGELLKRRRKRLLVLKQTESLLTLTAYDGRWHSDIKACGTATGRFAGGAVA